jgi:hypothetical protein
VNWSTLNFSGYYTIRGPVETEHKKFGLKGNCFSLTWRNLQEAPDLETVVLEAFQDLIDQAFEGTTDPNDLVNVQIDHPALDTPIYIGFSPREKLTPNRLLLLVQSVQQSKRDLRFDSKMHVRFTRIQFPRGGKGGRTCGDHAKWMEQHSRSGGFFVQIKNNDDRYEYCKV